MTLEVGTVRRVMRSARQVEVVKQPAYGVVTADYVSRRPPPPLSRVIIEHLSSSKYIVRRVAGNRRVILHDDFLHVDVSAVTAVDLQCDTPWALAVRNVGGGPSGTTQMPGDSDQAGALRLTVGSGADDHTHLHKDVDGLVAPGPPRALWVSFRAKMPDVATVDARIGLWDFNPAAPSALTNGVQMIVNQATYGTDQWQLGVQRAGGAGVAVGTTGDPAMDEVWQDFDLCMVASDWAAGWVDGSGPTAITDATYVPGVSDAYQPFFVIGDASNQLDIDWFRVESYEPASRPDRAFIEAPGEPTP